MGIAFTALGTVDIIGGCISVVLAAAFYGCFEHGSASNHSE